MLDRSRIALWFAALALLGVCPMLLWGQGKAQTGQAGQNRTVTNPLLVNVTGCLKKNSASDGYYIADANGRTWELTSKKIDLSKHVFHVVSVSGRPSTTAKTPEGKSEQQFGLDVTDLEIVSNSCTR
jgi:hypothetical protein